MSVTSLSRSYCDEKRSVLGIGLNDLDEEDMRDIRILEEFGISKENALSVAYEFYQQNGLNREQDIKDCLWRFSPVEEPMCQNDMWIFCTWGDVLPVKSEYENFIFNFDKLANCFLNLVQSLGSIYSESFYRIGDDNCVIDVTLMDSHHTRLVVCKVN